MSCLWLAGWLAGWFGENVSLLYARRQLSSTHGWLIMGKLVW
jgi:hypothetical protein